MRSTLSQAIRAMSEISPDDLHLRGVRTWRALSKLIADNCISGEAAVAAVVAIAGSSFRDRKEVLIQIVLDPMKDCEVRLAALSTFRSLDPLIEWKVVGYLKHNRDDELRLDLIFALRWIGGRNSCETIVRLTRDPNPAIRAAAAEVLGDLGCWVPRRVVERLLDDEEPNVRSFCLQSMRLLSVPGFDRRLARMAMLDSEKDAFGATISEMAEGVLERRRFDDWSVRRTPHGLQRRTQGTQEMV